MNSSKKIGIITHWWTEDNYGQLLQCFALQRLLNELGHRPFLIRYDYRLDKNDLTLIQKFKRALKALNLFKLYRYAKLNSKKKSHTVDSYKVDRNFDLFRRKYINYTLNTYSKKLIKQSPPEADIYITGSDQVWHGLNEIFFLNFGDVKIPRFSFAASFGRSSKHISEKQLTAYKMYLRALDFISVREQDGLELCRSLGRSDAVLFPDPTLLLSPKTYREIATPINEEHPYALVYMIDNIELTPVPMLEIKKYIEQRGIKIRYIASQGRIDNYSKIYPSINEFISYIDNSEFVITNSFHGTIFSILLNKNFVVLPKGTTTVDRIQNLLERFSIPNRLCTSIKEIEEIFAKDRLEFNKINELIRLEMENTTKQIKILMSSIHKIKKG